MNGVLRSQPIVNRCLLNHYVWSCKVWLTNYTPASPNSQQCGPKFHTTRTLCHPLQWMWLVLPLQSKFYLWASPHPVRQKQTRHRTMLPHNEAIRPERNQADSSHWHARRHVERRHFWSTAGFRIVMPKLKQAQSSAVLAYFNCSRNTRLLPGIAGTKRNYPLTGKNNHQWLIWRH